MEMCRRMAPAVATRPWHELPPWMEPLAPDLETPPWHPVERRTGPSTTCTQCVRTLKANAAGANDTPSTRKRRRIGEGTGGYLP